MSLGINSLGNVDWADPLLASLRPPRTMDVVVKTGEGALTRGTLLMPEIVESAPTGKYLKYDGTASLAGVLNEDIDATSADVKTYIMFDVDLKLSGVVSGVVDLEAGYFAECAINIIGG